MVRSCAADCDYNLDVRFIRFAAPVAMEIVVLTNILAPFTGPYLGGALLGEVVPLSSFELSLEDWVNIGWWYVTALFFQTVGAAPLMQTVSVSMAYRR